LGYRLRLDQGRSQAQRSAAIRDDDRWARHSFHPCAFEESEGASADHHARMADLRREGSACGGDSRLVGEAEGPGDRRRAQVGARGAFDELLADYRTAFLRNDVEGLSSPQIVQTLQARLGS